MNANIEISKIGHKNVTQLAKEKRLPMKQGEGATIYVMLFYQMNSKITISAASPRRGPFLTMRV